MWFKLSKKYFTKEPSVGYIVAVVVVVGDYWKVIIIWVRLVLVHSHLSCCADHHHRRRRSCSF